MADNDVLQEQRKTRDEWLRKLKDAVAADTPIIVTVMSGGCHVDTYLLHPPSHNIGFLTIDLDEIESLPIDERNAAYEDIKVAGELPGTLHA